MAYINKKDFSIMQSINELLVKDYFECDDLMAPAISLLNKKGYKTKFCCSGHTYPKHVGSFGKTLPNTYKMREIIYCEKSENLKGLYPNQIIESNPYYIIHISKVDPIRFYVSFEDKYNFPHLPEDAFFTNEGRCIRYQYPIDENDVFNNFEIILRMNKSFYEWIEKLPSLI